MKKSEVTEVRKFINVVVTVFIRFWELKNVKLL